MRKIYELKYFDGNGIYIHAFATSKQNEHYPEKADLFVKDTIIGEEFSLDKWSIKKSILVDGIHNTTHDGVHTVVTKVYYEKNNPELFL